MVYYVEDDVNIRELVVYTLNQTGLGARGFANAEEFFEAVAKEPPTLVLLDIMLPNGDGLSILRRLRSKSDTRALPVIMVTAKTAEYDKVIGLDSGADDYITKPFGMMELIARVKALIRRSAPEKPREVLSEGGLTLDVQGRAVSVHNQPVTLTYREFELLHHIMENRGIAFSRERLLETVWGYGYDGGTRTVDVHVQTLRQKLGDCSGLIETVRGVGYRFKGDGERL